MPSWFELQTRKYAGAINFYSSVFAWETTVASDSAQLRYTTFRSSAGGEDAGGIMDAGGFRPGGVPDEWSIYWEVEDCVAAFARVKALGGSTSNGPDETPYGVLALVADPFGAPFKLRTSPRE